MVVDDDGDEYYIGFPSAGRFVEYLSSRHPGKYSYRRTGSNTGMWTLNYDNNDLGYTVCVEQLTFTSPTTGAISYTCNDGETESEGNWRIIDIPSDGGGGGSDGGNGGDGEPGDTSSVPAHPTATARFSPSSLTVGEEARFIVEWNSVPDAADYKVYIDDFPIFYTQRGNQCTVTSSVLRSSTTTSTSYTYSFTASFINQYSLHCPTCNSSGECSCT